MARMPQSKGKQGHLVSLAFQRCFRKQFMEKNGQTGIQIAHRFCVNLPSLKVFSWLDYLVYRRRGCGCKTIALGCVLIPQVLLLLP